MKNTIKKTVTAVIFTLGLFLTLPTQGQPPPPPSDHGSGINQPANGGGAPIGSGVGILLALGAAYGGKKVWLHWRKLED